MKTLPANLVLEKNKLNADDPWLLLLEITLTSPVSPYPSTTVYLVRNYENVTYGGQVYTAFNFDFETTNYDSKGTIPQVILHVSNVGRALQPTLETYKGGVNSTVKLTVVHAGNLAEDHSELELLFTILSTVCTEEFVTFVLGAPNPLRQRFPLDKYIAENCRFQFKSLECGYDGEDSVCERTYEDCVTKSNVSRFGGFVGLKPGGLRIA